MPPRWVLGVLIIIAGAFLPQTVVGSSTLGLSTDVGSVPAAGSSAYTSANDSYQLAGTGTGIGGSADAFHFAYYQAVCGDGQITVRLASADALANAALVLRGSLEADALSAVVQVSGGSAGFVCRAQAGGSSTQGTSINASAPVWLRLTRSGVAVSALISSDGENWTNLGGVTVDLGGGTIYAGLAVSNGSASSLTLASASFDGLQSSFLPAGGLTLWLKADAGVTQDTNHLVSTWADQSDNAYDAFQNSASNQPSVVPDAINGKPVLRFDGSSHLQLPAGFSDFTQGATALVVAKPSVANAWQRFFELANGPSVDSIVFTRYSSSDQFLFECVNGNGSLVAEAGSSPGVIDLGTPQLFEFSQSGSGGAVTLYKNAQALTTQSAGVISNVTRTNNFIGYSNWGNARFQGDIAEIVLFDRALTDTERQAWESYLNAKYQYAAPPGAPTGLTASALVPGRTLLTWQNGGANVTSYTLERQNADGTWSVIATLGTGATSFVDINTPAGATYAYRITANGVFGSSLASATASVAVMGAGPALPLADLRLWLRADAGVSQDGNGGVSGWADLSGNANSASLMASTVAPSFLGGALNGKPAVRFSGSSALSLPAALMDGATSGEIFLVLRTTSPAGGSGGLMQLSGNSGPADLYPWHDGSLYEDFGSSVRYGPITPSVPLGEFNFYNLSSQPDEWTMRLNGTVQFTTSTNTVSFAPGYYLGREHDYGYFQGDIAEVLLFDRVLTLAERQAVVSYINARYQLASPPPSPNHLQATSLSSSQVAIGWDTPPGNTNSSYRVEQQNLDGSWSVIANLGVNRTSFIVTGLLPATQYTFRVTASNSFGDSSASEIPVTTSASTDAFPLDGFKLWLQASGGIELSSGGDVTRWHDYSGSGNDAVQSSGGGVQPTVAAGVLNGKPVVRFDASKQQYFQVPNFLSGAAGGEVFMVVKRTTADSSNGGLAPMPSGN